MRVAYLKHSSFLSCSALCCFKPFLFCANFGEVCLEIALFKRSYRPDESIQALVNLGEHVKQIKKVTMSLYMMIEIKDPEESNQILRKYTISERIFEQVHDFRTTRTKDKNKPKELLQRGIIMSIDLPTMSQHYKEKKKKLLQKSVTGKE